jgi:hypothetical protein
LLQLLCSLNCYLTKSRYESSKKIEYLQEIFNSFNVDPLKEEAIAIPPSSLKSFAVIKLAVTGRILLDLLHTRKVQYFKLSIDQT